MQSLNKEMMKVLNKTTLQVSRYQTDKTKSGYQEKLEWFVNEKQLVNKLNDMIKYLIIPISILYIIYTW